jgi:hypothetical protein
MKTMAPMAPMTFVRRFTGLAWQQTAYRHEPRAIARPGDGRRGEAAENSRPPDIPIALWSAAIRNADR